MSEEPRKNVKRFLEGVVVSNAPDKTIVVRVTRRVRHPLYGKVITQVRKAHAHDEANTAQVGDRVRLVECRPLSRLKRWRLVTVVSPAQPA